MRGILPLRFGTLMPAKGVGSEDASSVSSVVQALARRQLIQRENDDDYDPWFWYSTTGIIIKYTLFFAFLLLIVGWVVGGRIHAKRRYRKGLKPMAYHAWLLSRQERAQVDPTFIYTPHVPAYGGVYRPAYGNNPDGGDYYGMHAMPPPVYDPHRPPMYDGPPPKADDAQPRPQGQDQAPDYAPPAGPPPGAGRAPEYAPPAGPPPGPTRYA